MVTVKAGQIQRAKGAIARVMTTEVPFKTAYRLMRIGKKLESELKTLEEARIKLVKELGVKDDKGNHTVPKENMEAFVKQHDETMQVEVTIDVDLIPHSALELMKITASDLIEMEPFIDNPGECVEIPQAAEKV